LVYEKAPLTNGDVVAICMNCGNRIITDGASGYRMTELNSISGCCFNPMYRPLKAEDKGEVKS
jgi:hypothetical protein